MTVAIYPATFYSSGFAIDAIFSEMGRSDRLYKDRVRDRSDQDALIVRKVTYLIEERFEGFCSHYGYAKIKIELRNHRFLIANLKLIQIYA